MFGQLLSNSVVVVRTRPRAIPLAMITMRKSTHEFPFLSYMSKGFRYRRGGAYLKGGAYLQKKKKQTNKQTNQKEKNGGRTCYNLISLGGGRREVALSENTLCP